MPRTRPSLIKLITAENPKLMRWAVTYDAVYSQPGTTRSP